MMDSYKTVGENTYEMIKKDIIFGNLSPLKKLKLNALKINYKTSISTLREILSRLSGDGFVLYEEQKGFYDDDEYVKHVMGGSSRPLFLPQTLGVGNQRGFDFMRLFLWTCDDCRNPEQSSDSVRVQLVRQSKNSPII